MVDGNTASEHEVFEGANGWAAAAEESAKEYRPCERGALAGDRSLAIDHPAGASGCTTMSSASEYVRVPG